MKKNFACCLPSGTAAFWTTQLHGPATSFSVRWRFIYVNGTLRRDITKPLFLALRASFTETFSVRLSRLPESAEKRKQKFRQETTRHSRGKNSSNRSKVICFVKFVSSSFVLNIANRNSQVFPRTILFTVSFPLFSSRNRKSNQSFFKVSRIDFNINQVEL